MLLFQIHLSFSLQGGGDSDKPIEIHANVLNVFLQSVGVVLTDIQDVVFKWVQCVECVVKYFSLSSCRLGYFERCHNFYNQSNTTVNKNVLSASLNISLSLPADWVTSSAVTTSTTRVIQPWIKMCWVRH